MKKQSTISILVIIGIIAAAQVFIFATRTDNASLSQGDSQKKALQSQRIYSPTLPDSMTFAGETVPLDIYYVREGLDREMIVNTFGHTSTLLYFKRAHRFFPVIEPILKKNGIPADFKYLCVIESGLTNATSPAKAQGFWQFIKATGQKYGLEITDEIDMRNDLEASTHAACKYLKYLKRRMGNWTNAAAAYQLKLSELTPIVGATIKTLAIIEPKQHGQGAIIAREVAVDVFLSCIFHSLIVNKPAIIMIEAIMI